MRVTPGRLRPARCAGERDGRCGGRDTVGACGTRRDRGVNADIVARDVTNSCEIADAITCPRREALHRRTIGRPGVTAPPRPRRSATGCATRPGRDRDPPLDPVSGARRRRRRGGRVHRPVDGDRPDRHGPVAAGRGPRGRDGRLRGERPERRLLRGVADPRPRERPAPLPRRAGDPRAEGSRTWPRSRRSSATTASTATSSGPATSSVADQPYQVDELKAWVDEAAEWGEELVFLDRAAVREEVHSPLWQAGLFRPPAQGRDALVDPAKLVRGLARVAAEQGVAIHERSRVESVERRAGGRRRPDGRRGEPRADHVVVATSAYSGWLRRLARSSCRSTTTRSSRSR